MLRNVRNGLGNRRSVVNISRETVFKLIALAVLIGSVYGAWIMMDYRGFVNEPIRFGQQGLLYEIKSGKTEDEVAANTSITKTYDDLGYSWAFITSEKIRRTFYKSLK